MFETKDHSQITCKLCGFKPKSKKGKKAKMIKHLYQKHFRTKFLEEYDDLIPKTMPFSCPMKFCTFQSSSNDRREIIRHVYATHRIMKQYYEECDTSTNITFETLIKNEDLVCKLCGYEILRTNRMKTDMAKHLYANHFKSKFLEDFDHLIPKTAPFSCPMKFCNFQSITNERREFFRHVYTTHNVMKHYYEQCDISKINLPIGHAASLLLPSETISISNEYKSKIENLMKNETQILSCKLCGFEIRRKRKIDMAKHLYGKHFKSRFLEEYDELIPKTAPFPCPIQFCEFQTISVERREILRHVYSTHGIMQQYYEQCNISNNIPFESTISNKETLIKNEILLQTCKLCGFKSKNNPSKKTSMARHLYGKHFRTKFLEEYDHLIPKTAPFTCPMQSCNFQSMTNERREFFRHVYTTHNIMNQYYEQCDISNINLPIGQVDSKLLCFEPISVPTLNNATKADISTVSTKVYFKKTLVPTLLDASKIKNEVKRTSPDLNQSIYCDIVTCDFLFHTVANKNSHLYEQHFKEKFEIEYGKIFEKGGGGEEEFFGCPDCNYQHKISSLGTPASSPFLLKGPLSSWLTQNLKIHYFTKHGILEKYLKNELLMTANEKSNSEHENYNDKNLIQNSIMIKNEQPIKNEVLSSPSSNNSLLKNPRKRRNISDRKPAKVNSNKVREIDFTKKIKLEHNRTDFIVNNQPVNLSQFYTENIKSGGKKFREIEFDEKKSSNIILNDKFLDNNSRTQVMLTIDNDNVYQFKIPKPEVCLDDIKKYLLRKPERYSISNKKEKISQFEFRAKITIDGKNCFEEYDENDDYTVLPKFPNGKIMLECWTS